MSDLVTRLSVLAEDDGDRYPAHVKKLAEAAASRIAALEAKLAEAREALAESDRQAEKLEALLDPHIAWEGKPAKAYAELTEALQKAEADAARMREALREAAAALDQAREDVACWGSYAGEYFQDKHDLEGDLDRLAKQASAARRALEECE